MIVEKGNAFQNKIPIFWDIYVKIYGCIGGLSEGEEWFCKMIQKKNLSTLLPEGGRKDKQEVSKNNKRKLP